MSRLKDSQSEAESVLARVLYLMNEGKIDDGKDEWVQFLSRNGTHLEFQAGKVVNMFGGQLNLFLSFFCNSFSLACISECSNGPAVCSRFRWSLQTSKLIRFTSPVTKAGNDIQTQIEAFLAEKSTSQCSYTVQPNLSEKVLSECSRIMELIDEDDRKIYERVCNGQRVIREKTWRQECWMVPFDLQKLKESEIFDLPDVITVNSTRYHLRGVTVLDNDHFAAYVRKMKSWYYYCGMFEAAGRKVTVPRLGKPQVAIYTL